MGDQIEYLPPTVSGNATIEFSAKPKVLAFSVFAVITIELVESLSLPSHFKHDNVSSVDSDLDEKI